MLFVDSVQQYLLTCQKRNCANDHAYYTVSVHRYAKSPGRSLKNRLFEYLIVLFCMC